MTDRKSVGRRFKEESRKLGKTQKDIARVLDCTIPTIVGWNSGRNYPSAYYLGVMYEAGLDIVYIITGKHTRGGDTRA